MFLLFFPLGKLVISILQYPSSFFFLSNEAFSILPTSFLGHPYPSCNLPIILSLTYPYLSCILPISFLHPTSVFYPCIHFILSWSGCGRVWAGASGGEEGGRGSGHLRARGHCPPLPCLHRLTLPVGWCPGPSLRSPWNFEIFIEPRLVEPSFGVFLVFFVIAFFCFCLS